MHAFAGPCRRPTALAALGLTLAVSALAQPVPCETQERWVEAQASVSVSVKDVPASLRESAIAYTWRAASGSGGGPETAPTVYSAQRLGPPGSSRSMYLLDVGWGPDDRYPSLLHPLCPNQVCWGTILSQLSLGSEPKGMPDMFFSHTSGTTDLFRWNPKEAAYQYHCGFSRLVEKKPQADPSDRSTLLGAAWSAVQEHWPGIQFRNLVTDQVLEATFPDRPEVVYRLAVEEPKPGIGRAEWWYASKPEGGNRYELVEDGQVWRVVSMAVLD